MKGKEYMSIQHMIKHIPVSTVRCSNNKVAQILLSAEMYW